MDICQLKLKAGSHFPPQGCCPSVPMACLSPGPWSGCYLCPMPCAVPQPGPAPHPLTPAVLPACTLPAPAVLLVLLACHPACAPSLLVALSLIAFTLHFQPSLALKFSCSICQLTHHLSFTAETLSPHHNPLFSTSYISAVSALVLCSLLDVILGRRVSKPPKSDPEPCPSIVIFVEVSVSTMSTSLLFPCTPWCVCLPALSLILLLG